MTTRYEIACDWDGVIDSYATGHKERPDVFNDPPVPGAIAWLTECHVEGRSVIINSTRLEHDDHVLGAEIEAAMKAYLIANGCPVDVAHGLHFWTGEGKPRAKIYIDDRGYRFEGVFPSVKEMDGMDVWNRNARTKARHEMTLRADYDAQAIASMDETVKPRGR